MSQLDIKMTSGNKILNAITKQIIHVTKLTQYAQP